MVGPTQGEVRLDARQLWQSVLGDLEVRLPRGAFENWLRPTSLVEFADDVATIAAPNMFSASTLQTRYAGQVERALSGIVGRPVQAEFTVRTATKDGAHGDSGPSPTVRETQAILSQPDPSGSSPGSRRSGGRKTSPAPASSQTPSRRPTQQLELAATPTHGLNPRYVYESYVVGGSNRFAHAASLSVAEHPGGKFNPFFVHGGVGLGKTHLLHAIGHRALELYPDLTIVYVSSEKFTNDLINAIRAQRMEEFRARYRTIDVLMIDDIQFIAGKESTQEEFFHTFNTLYQSGKQVVISSDRPPKSIAALHDRLRSRFEGGLIADVQFPDYEMRTAILRTKGEELSAAVPDDVVEYIAQKDQSNIRELEGALNKVLFQAQASNRAVTLHQAMEALTDAAITARRAQTSAEDVVEAVGAYYKVSVKDLRGRVRTKEIVLPRQVAMYLLREETDGSLADIGHALGGRDHTTVMHGIEKIERTLTTDTTLRAQLMSIREALYIGSQ